MGQASPPSSHRQVPLAIRGDSSDYRLIDEAFGFLSESPVPAAEQEWTLDSIRWNVQIDAKKFKPTGESAR